MDRSSISSRVSKKHVFGVVLGTLITGTINSLIFKEQDRVHNKDNKAFFHPIVQTFLMFLAEMLALFVFFCSMKFSINFKNDYVIKREEARRVGVIIKTSPLLPLLPSLIDLFGSTFQFISIFSMDPSLYVMLRGGVPITTAIFSVLFLENKLYAHHNVGLISVALGVGLVGFVELSQEGQGSSKALKGLLFGLGSLVTTGIQYVVEERVLSKYFFHPLRLVGFEGLWGILLGAGAVAIAHFIPCSATSEFCNNGTFENLGNAVSFIFGDVHLLLLIIIALINSSFFNFFGISITKHVSPLTRTTISVLVTCLVWVYSMIWLGHKFYILQLVGFAFIVLGNLIYQEIIEIPGLNNNTRKNQERRALFNESLAIEDDDD